MDETFKALLKDDYLDVLKRARLIKGISQREVAKRTNNKYSPQWISHHFTGVNANSYALIAICKVLDIEFKTLLKEPKKAASLT